MNPNPEMDPILDALIQGLKRHAPRDPQAASRARDSFMAEAAQISPRVSNLHRHRLEEWKEKLTIFWYGARKEKNFMFNFVMSVILVLGLVLGTGATTVAAAQSAQPDAVLYPVKTWSEDVRMGWETDPQAKLNLALQFAKRRSEEIQISLATGTVIPQPVLTRFENQQRLALNLAAGLPENQAQPALEQIRNQARQQEQLMAQIQIGDPAAQQIRARVQTMLQTQAQIAQQGIDSPAWLREQLRLHENNRFRLSTPTIEVTEDPKAPGTGSGPGATGTPNQGNGNGPGNPQTPSTDEALMPGSGNGPGPGAGGNASATPTPNMENPQKQPSTQPGQGNDGQSDDGDNGQPGNGNGNKP